MSSRLRIRKKSTRIETPDISTAPAQGMFQSRPFVVQTHSTEKSQRQPDLKTALMRAQRYGHHLGRMQPTGVSAPKVIQPKLENGQQVESERPKAPQALQAASVQKGESEALGMGNSTSGVHQENQTGMSDNLQSGVETLSGLSLNDVKVHYNSAKPTQLQAHAYTQGTDIHVEPGQEKHLAHEAWNVMQQKQGGVNPTGQVEDISLNNAQGLEHEADVMGAKAMQMKQVYQVATEVPSRREVAGENLGKMPLNSLCIQKMKIRGTNQLSEVSSITKNKHVVALGDQATKAEAAYGSSTFVTSEAILTSAVNANQHNFTEAANKKSDRFDFQANVPINLWEKTGPKAMPEKLGKGEPVSKTIDGQNTTCEIGVVKAGDDKIKVTHFKKT